MRYSRFLTTILLSSLSSPALAATLHLQSPQVSSWKTLSPVPTGPIHEHTTVTLSPTQLVIIGGVLQSGAVINAVYLYTIPTDTWKKLAPFPVPINHANAAAMDGKIYVLGGLIVSGGQWVGTPRSWVYDSVTGDKWTELDPMPVSVSQPARGSAVVGVYNGTVWLVSGKTGSGSNGMSATAVSAFDTVSRKWTTDIPEKARNIPEGRDHGGGGVVGSKLYQIGGSLGAIANRKDTVFVLDLEDVGKGWVTAGGKMPTPRRGFATGLVGGVFYTFGGEGNPDTKSNGVFGEVEAYDTEGGRWVKLEGMRIPRHGSYAASVDGKIYIPGGGTASGMPATDAFDVFVP